MPFRRLGGPVALLCALLGAATATGQPLPGLPGSVPGSGGLPVQVGAQAGPVGTAPVNPYFVQPQPGAGAPMTIPALVTGAPAAAEPIGVPPPDDIKGRLERLEQQNQVLQDRLRTLTGGTDPPAANKADEERKKEEERVRKEVEGYVIGTELGMTARWKTDTGLWFETPNGDFKMHMGFWMQWDTTSWTQSATTKPANQLGDFQDGT
jgi:hypothetical protein